MEMYGRVVVWLYAFLALVVDGMISQLDAPAALPPPVIPQYPFHGRMSETIMYVKVLTACGTENGYLNCMWRYWVLTACGTENVYLKSCRTGFTVIKQELKGGCLYIGHFC